jgi:hypothetical protein
MKPIFHRAVAALVVVATSTAACTKDGSKGGSAAKPSDTRAAQKTQTERDDDTEAGSSTETGSVDTTPDCDPEKEYHKLKFPESVDLCRKAGKLWNFDSNECGTMNAAYEEFKCADFESVKSELTGRGLSTGRLDAEKGKGGKLIGCGVSNSGDVVVAQVFHRGSTTDANDCLYTKAGKVVSLCFQVFTADDPPPAVSGETAEREYVRKCLNTE